MRHPKGTATGRAAFGLAASIALPVLLATAACNKVQRTGDPAYSSLVPGAEPEIAPQVPVAAAAEPKPHKRRLAKAVRTTAKPEIAEASVAKAEPAEIASAEATIAAPATATAAAMPAEEETAADEAVESAGPGEEERAVIARWAEGTAKELARICPIGDPSDTAAFEACKQRMHRGSLLREALSPVTLWGRQHKDPRTPLTETDLTQFSPDVLTGLYMPLFMFNGTSRVEWSEQEKLYRVELGVAFRNRLKPGEFPYPFWHNEEKWDTYQRANAMLLWVSPKSHEIRVAQFSKRGTPDGSVAIVPQDQPPHDGKWMWTDANGVTQPKVTLFDGLYRDDNPYLGKIDASYRMLALSLREGNCATCHAPGNPARMKRLVLLQTPAHAAGEIKRLIKAVEADRMPVDEATSMAKPLEAGAKAELLERAKAFEALIEKARAWEASRSRQSAAADP